MLSVYCPPAGQCRRCILCAYELDAADVYLSHELGAGLAPDLAEISMIFELVLHQSLCFLLESPEVPEALEVPEVPEALEQDLLMAVSAQTAAAGDHHLVEQYNCRSCSGDMLQALVAWAC